MKLEVKENRIKLIDMPVGSLARIAVCRDEVVFHHQSGWLNLSKGKDYTDDWANLTVIPLEPGEKLVFEVT
jgi:hypothetical protein